MTKEWPVVYTAAATPRMDLNARLVFDCKPKAHDAEGDLSVRTDKDKDVKEHSEIWRHVAGLGKQAFGGMEISELDDLQMFCALSHHVVPTAIEQAKAEPTPAASVAGPKVQQTL